MLSTSTYCLYTTRNVRQKHSRIIFEPMGIIPKQVWSRAIASELRTSESKVQIHWNAYIYPWDFCQLHDWLEAKNIKCKLVTHHQTHIQALTKTLCHSMVHRRLWEIIQVFSYLCRHIFISLHFQPIAIVLHIIPTYMLCHPLMLTTPESIYGWFQLSIPIFFPHDLFHHSWPHS